MSNLQPFIALDTSYLFLLFEVFSFIAHFGAVARETSGSVLCRIALWECFGGLNTSVIG